MKILTSLILITISIPLFIFGIYAIKKGSIIFGLFLIICNTFIITISAYKSKNIIKSITNK